jgi:hypothetical protein
MINRFLRYKARALNGLGHCFEGAMTFTVRHTTGREARRVICQRDTWFNLFEEVKLVISRNVIARDPTKRKGN